MKLEPINPQEFTDYVAYSEKKRTRWERFLDKIKPRSAAMRTAVLVVFVVLFSLFMSLWFFWRTLYLPEIQQHARYLAVELEILNNPDLRIFHNEAEVDVDAWLKNRVGIEYVTDPREPLTRDKLMNLARGREWGAMERSIDVQVSRLRRLIEENPARARYIQTVWGVGYVFVPDGAE